MAERRRQQSNQFVNKMVFMKTIIFIFSLLLDDVGHSEV